MDAHRCPICDKRFSGKKSLVRHVTFTTKHNDALEELWRLRFLLAETEHERDVYREQRDEWRTTAQSRRVA